VAPQRVALGLRANWRQFWLLVLINAFVGSMVGLERTVLPLLAERDFALVSSRAALSFLVTFGITKAVTNALAGRLGDRIGRKRVLVIGWLFAVPVPLLVIWAQNWSWVILANALLGVNQGLTWSTTVIMKIDLVGQRQRGLAMGLNECAGYLAVAVTAFATGQIASRFGLRPEPFYLGIACAAVGLALSVLFVRDTTSHVAHEAARHLSPAEPPTIGTLFALTTWRDPALSSVSQAGLVNNLNDGLAWGLFPLFFAAQGLSIQEIGVLASVYPAVWGVCQMWTGALSDRVGRKWLIVAGMFIQSGALLAMSSVHGFGRWIATAVSLGIGTALVYPTLLAVVGDVAHPKWRGSAVGFYRFWRDIGYAAGALVAGALADAVGMRAAIVAIGALTAASGALVAIRMPERLVPTVDLEAG
jgi:MFS family permease